MKKIATKKCLRELTEKRKSGRDLGVAKNASRMNLPHIDSSVHVVFAFFVLSKTICTQKNA